MATSKTLTPTNVTISIPEFTDQPDQRVNSNCLDKEADAINALNSKIDNILYGATVTVPVDLTSTGFKRVNWTCPSVPTGYHYAGFLSAADTGRFCIMESTMFQLFIYVIETSTSSFNANITPIFKRN